VEITMIRASGNSARISRVASAPLDRRQALVHQRHVGSVEPVERQCLLAGRRLGADRQVALEGDDVGEPHPDQVVVVDQQDLEPLARAQAALPAAVSRGPRR
jgi:hypothetical protein